LDACSALRDDGCVFLAAIGKPHWFQADSGTTGRASGAAETKNAGNAGVLIGV